MIMLTHEHFYWKKSRTWRGRGNLFEIRSMDYAHLTRSCIGNTKAAATKAGSRELYKLRLVKLHGHWLEKKTILWKKNEHSRWLYSIQGAIFPRLIITSSGVDTQVTSESVLIRFESVLMFVSTFSFLWHSYKCQASCRVSNLGDFVLGLMDCPFLNKNFQQV